MEPWRYIYTHSHLDTKWRLSLHFMVRNNLSVHIFCEDILQKRKISFDFAQNCSPISCSSTPQIMKTAQVTN